MTDLYQITVWSGVEWRAWMKVRARNVRQALHRGGFRLPSFRKMEPNRVYHLGGERVKVEVARG